MQPLQYVVRWTDPEGKEHSKTYGDDPSARKAKAWLIERGAVSVDIAISMGSREFKSNGNAIPEGAKPGIEQSSFIK